MQGHVVWHDLFTSKVEEAKVFYSALLGFEHVVEHATDFAWSDGPGDYTLLQMDGEAHGGIVGVGPDAATRWLPYVAVEDVDHAARRARRAGASIVRAPFDAPGVGRSCVVEDPQGARICPFVAAHDYPPPSGVFVWDELAAPDPASVLEIYRQCFQWTHERDRNSESGRRWTFGTAEGAPVASVAEIDRGDASASNWIPYFAAPDLKLASKKSDSLGAQPIAKPTRLSAGREAQLFIDPLGAVFGLIGD